MLVGVVAIQAAAIFIFLFEWLSPSGFDMKVSKTDFSVFTMKPEMIFLKLFSGNTGVEPQILTFQNLLVSVGCPLPSRRSRRLSEGIHV